MRRLLVVLLVAAAAFGGWTYWKSQQTATSGPLRLFGDVDLRQVELAFNGAERIAAVLVQEGERVTRGQVVARLDKGRLVPQVEQARALVAAQAHVVARLHAGSRPEEIAQAKANLESAKADAENAKRQHDRLKELSTRSISLQEFENAKAALDMATARLVVTQKALDLAVAGPRREDVAEGEARLAANKAQLDFLEQQLRDADLVAPTDAVVRSRLLEPGEMASPQRPVITLAILDPKWVRAYAAEPDLPRVRPGMKARVTVDGIPGRAFEGWVGFISPVAEFTPKAVQVEELRTSLVYEVRVFVKDEKDELRLGMPATCELVEK